MAAFEEWRAWLVGTNTPVAVFSDHANLRYFMTSKKLTPQQVRWASYLSSFYFSILHTPGKQNPADPASRRPDYAPNSDTESSLITLLTPTQLKEGFTVMSLSSSVSSIDITFSLPSPETRGLLTTAYLTKTELLTQPPTKLYQWQGNLWWYRDRLYVQKSARLTILTAFHDSPTAGHPGVARMLSSLTRTYSWPTIRHEVIQFCRPCDSCERTRILTQPPAGHLIPLPIPDQPWSVIGIDFIVKLPRSSSFDSILVITDHLTKGAHFIACNEAMDSACLARLFVHQFFCLHGFPDKIVSDRGPSFVSAFWRSVLHALRISPAPSTAYHPQTNGQTERSNQTLETYIRHSTCHRQDDWAEWLSMAEFTFNNSTLASTKLTPFFSWQGFHPRANSFTIPSKVPNADKFVAQLEDIQLVLVESLRHAKEIQARNHNRHARPAPAYAVGDWVWLSRRFIPSARPSPKFDYRRIGPFQISKLVGANTAQLNLESSLQRLHPVFNVSLLTPYIAPTLGGRPDSTAPKEPVTESTPIHQWSHVSGILDHRNRGKKQPEYLLRWLHGSPADDTWVPLTNISTNIEPFLLQFHRQYPQFQIPSALLNNTSRIQAGKLAVAP